MIFVFSSRVLTLLCLMFFLGCAKNVQKPEISITKYSRQVTEMNIVVQKLMAETNPKLMHDIALGVESGRVVLCDPVGDECNLYYKLINKMVFVTNDGVISAEDRALLEKMNAEFQQELKRTEDIVVKEWNEYVSQEGIEATEVQIIKKVEEPKKK